MSCFCTGRCFDTGRCPATQQAPYRPCNHVFPWWGIYPPTYCPLCGASLIRPPYYPSYPTTPFITRETPCA